MKNTCPYAHYVKDEMMCQKTQDYCGNVKFCRMSGRVELTEASAKCPVRLGIPEKKKPTKKATK